MIRAGVPGSSDATGYMENEKVLLAKKEWGNKIFWVGTKSFGPKETPFI